MMELRWDVELSSDMMSLQRLFDGVVKNTGDFAKIKYKGGNEMKINQVIKCIEDHLQSMNYIEKRKTNRKYQKQLESLTFFLAINMDFKDNSVLDCRDLFHVMRLIPKLSLCLVANIIVELDLVEYYCSAFQTLPEEISEELFCEFIPCVKRVAPELSIEYTCMIVKSIITKIIAISSSSQKIREIIDHLEDIITELLPNLSSINVDSMQVMKKTQIYTIMGFALLNLLKLIQICPTNCNSLTRTLVAMLKTCSNIMQAVTVDVFCVWAEVDHEGRPLQAAIANEAYLVVERVQKMEQSKDVVQMLASIARKPKTLNEIILEADTSTIIAKVREKTPDCKKWFVALLNAKVFENAEAMKCLDENANLCSLWDVSRLLGMLVHGKNKEGIKIVLKCASHVKESELVVILAKFFYQHGLKNALGNETALSQLTVALNKLHSSNCQTASKDIMLLLLQEPELVVTHLYRECIKSDVFFTHLRETFRACKDIIEIESLFLKALAVIMVETPLHMDNFAKYYQLFYLICEQTSAYRKLMDNVILVHTARYIENNNCEELKPMFMLYTDIVKPTNEQDVRTMLETCFTILEKFRWTLFTFSNAKSDLCFHARISVIHYQKRNFVLKGLASKHIINSYYFKTSKDDSGAFLDDTAFFDHVCPKFSLDTHAEAVGCLIKILPLCLSSEWTIIAQHLIKERGHDKMVELFTDSLILICQVVKTQNGSEQRNIYSGLKYCLQNFGMVLKNLVMGENNDDLYINVARYICRLLKDIPKELESPEGMSLASVIPETSLKSLKCDKSFVCVLASMQDSAIARCLAKKMLT